MITVSLREGVAALWFSVWFPIFLLYYILLNGAAHMDGVYLASGLDPGVSVLVLLRTGTLLQLLWPFSTSLLVLLAWGSWRILSVWRAVVWGWLVKSVSIFLFLTLLIVQMALVFPAGGTVKWPPGRVGRAVLAQTWVPHPPGNALVDDVACLLESVDPTMRRCGIRALKDLRAVGYAKEIAGMLEDPDPQVTATAQAVLDAWEAQGFSVSLTLAPKSRGPRPR